MARSRRSSRANCNPATPIDLRGPIGGHFVWSASEARRPLLLVGGGSGVVPLMCMLRHRKLSGGRVPAALLYSCRTREDMIYHEGLGGIARGDPRFTLRITLTRERPPGWSGALGRIDLPMIRALLERLGGMADCFVCGGDGFVEAASVLLMQAGHPVARSHDDEPLVDRHRNLVDREITDRRTR